jgi:hydroxymethylbilane synthase
MTLDAALGHAEELTRPLLKVRVAATVADESAARALGARAVSELRAAGAAAYLPAA